MQLCYHLVDFHLWKGSRAYVCYLAEEPLDIVVSKVSPSKHSGVLIGFLSEGGNFATGCYLHVYVT